jgi:hypothetical protein
MTSASSRTERAETVVQVLILIGIADMAGAASFTHVHDWTMRNAPHGTGSWFGWANAVITELVPATAGIEIRRRKRQHRPVTYPMTILVTDAVVSVAIQLSDAVHTLAGGLAFALPVLAFLALTKLVLSRTTTEPGDPSCAETASTPDAHGQMSPAAAPATPGPTTPAPTADGLIPALTAAPAASTPTPEPDLRDLRPIASGQLLISARMTAFNHQQETGQPITPGQLAERLAIPPALAGSLIDHLGGTPPPVTAVNGTPIHGEGRP